MPIDPFKATVVELALRAAATQGFALAGGNALAAHGLLSRPTQDIDLFTSVAGGTGQVIDAVRAALTDRQARRRQDLPGPDPPPAQREEDERGDQQRDDRVHEDGEVGGESDADTGQTGAPGAADARVKLLQLTRRGAGLRTHRPRRPSRLRNGVDVWRSADVVQ